MGSLARTWMSHRGATDDFAATVRPVLDIRSGCDRQLFIAARRRLCRRRRFVW